MQISNSLIVFAYRACLLTLCKMKLKSTKQFKTNFAYAREGRVAHDWCGNWQTCKDLPSFTYRWLERV